ncbi:hypothetical protein OAO72_06170 [Alphaproteobacteria bacterium]|nr:hypothetical protein [Alphaproteobacteria bacterium]
MGITFFEDNELITFAQSAMRGVILQDDAPRPRVNRNISMLLSTEDQKPRPKSVKSSKTSSMSMKESVDFLKQGAFRESSHQKEPKPALIKHIHDSFQIGFGAKKTRSLSQSNIMNFANDNSTELYRYFRYFLEREENSWMDAELFEKALIGWVSPSNLQTEALERLEKAYASFNAETNHLSHNYNERTHQINRSFELNFEQLKSHIYEQNKYTSRQSADEIENLLTSINFELPELLDEQQAILREVINRNQIAAEKFKSYLSETSKTLIEQSKIDEDKHSLQNNAFALRRIQEHAKSISTAKQAVRKAFD